MLNSFWNWFVIIGTVASMLACWWLLHWTKGISNRKGSGIGSTGHVWDEDLVELNAPLPRWWLHLFNLTIIFGFIYFLLYPGLGNFGGVLGWTQLSQWEQETEQATAVQQQVFAQFRDMTPEQLVASDAAMDIGRRLFGNNCAMCHGSDGRGAVGFPNLTDDEWQWGAGYDNILTAIRQGRQGIMPPLAMVLGEEGVPQVVAYVRQLSGQPADAELAAAGQPLFQMQCAACHGIDGGGNPMLGAPSLNDGTWLYGGSVEALTQTLTEGRNGNMPSHASILDEDRQRLVAAYVLYLNQGR